MGFLQNAYNFFQQRVAPAATQAVQQTFSNQDPFIAGVKAAGQSFVDLGREGAAIAYGVKGAVTPGQTFQGNVQQFNQAIPQPTFGDQAVQQTTQANNLNPAVMNVFNQAAHVGAQLAVPIPGFGEVKAFEGLQPLPRALGYDALRGVENVGYGQAQNLATNGQVDPSRALSDFGYGAVGNAALSPLAHFHAAQDLAQGYKVGQAVTKLNRDVPERAGYVTKINDGTVGRPNNVNVTTADRYQRFNVPNAQAEEALRTGKVPDTSKPVVNDYSKTPSGTTELVYSPDGKQLVAVNPDNQAFAQHLRQQSYLSPQPGFAKLTPKDTRTPEEITAAAQAKTLPDGITPKVVDSTPLPDRNELARRQNLTKQGIDWQTGKPLALAPRDTNGRLLMKTLPPDQVEGRLNVNRLNVNLKAKAAADKVSAGAEVPPSIGAPLTHEQIKSFAETNPEDAIKTVTRDTTAKLGAAQLNNRKAIADLAEKQVKGQLTPGDIGKFVDRITADESLAAHAARMLGQRNINAGAQSPMEDMVRRVLKSGVDINEIKRAAAGVDFNDANQSAQFYRQFIQPKMGDWLDLIRYNSMLSSPTTHINNAFGNLQSITGVIPATKTVAGIIDWLTPGKQTHFAGEGLAYLQGSNSITTIKSAIGKFSDTLTGKSANTNLDLKNIPLAPKGGLPGAAEKALSGVSQLLEASDQFFHTLATAGEKASLDYKASKGVKVGNIDQKAKEGADYALYRADFHPKGQGAILHAIDYLAGKVDQLRHLDAPQDAPIGLKQGAALVRTIAKFTVPFLKTVVNLGKQGFEYTPFGVTTAIGAEDKTTQIAKAVIGSTVFAGAATLLGSGRLTWGAPASGTAERQAWDKAHRQPYSVNLGTESNPKWIAYNKMAPALSFPIALVASLDDAQKQGKVTDNALDVVLREVSSYGSFLSDQSYAQGIGNLLNATKNGEAGVAQVLASNVQQLVPYRALMGWMARLSDDTLRTTDKGANAIQKQVQLMMQQIPGLSEQTPAKTDQQGNPIKVSLSDRVTQALSPVKVSTGDTQGEQQYNQFETNKQQNAQASQQEKLMAEQAKNGSQPTKADQSLPDGVQKLANGKYAYTLNDGTVATAKTPEIAQLNLAKDEVSNGVQQKVKVGDKIVYMDDNGNVQVASQKAITANTANAQYAISSQELKAQKNYSGWKNLQERQVVNLEQQKNSLDPEIDSAKIITLTNQQEDIRASIDKYDAQGGFSSGSAAAGKAAALKTAQFDLQADRLKRAGDYQGYLGLVNDRVGQLQSQLAGAKDQTTQLRLTKQIEDMQATANKVAANAGFGAKPSVGTQVSLPSLKVPSIKKVSVPRVRKVKIKKTKVRLAKR